MVLQGTEAPGHKCCCYSCFLWSFSSLRVAFLLSQGEIRHRRLEPGSHCSLVSPKERIYRCPFPNPKQEVLSAPLRENRYRQNIQQLLTGIAVAAKCQFIKQKNDFLSCRKIFHLEPHGPACSDKLVILLSPVTSWKSILSQENPESCEVCVV